MLALGAYTAGKLMQPRALGAAAGASRTLALVAGACIPVGMLLAYQWWAFGNPILPAQSYMPATEYSVRGWFGMRLPDLDLMLQNFFDPRFGLFAFCPLLLVGVFALARSAVRDGAPGHAEAALGLGILLGLWLFSSANQFGRLQWNTGVRYLVPAVPILFLGVAAWMQHRPRGVVWVVATGSVLHSWVVTMVREDLVESWRTVLEHGPRLPWLTVLGQMGGQYVEAFADGPPNPLPLMLAVAAAVTAIWWPWGGRRVAP